MRTSSSSPVASTSCRPTDAWEVPLTVCCGQAGVRWRSFRPASSQRFLHWSLGWVAHDLTLVPTDGASWPSRRTPRRDVLAVHHAKLRRITAPDPPSGGRHGADHHPLGRTSVPE